MWAFKGEYSGEAKARMQQLKNKGIKALAIGASSASAFAFLMMAIMMSDGELWAILTFLGGGILTIALVNLVCWIESRRAPKCDVEIKNDGVYFCEGGSMRSFVFYKIQEIEYYDEFVVLKPHVVLQKELLIEGDWDELISLLKRVEESLDTDDPMYQIDEPETEFFEATVKSKRVYKRFDGIQMVHSVYQHFATFALANGEEIEYEIGEELYEKISEGEAGTLVLISGRFFSFGNGEPVE